MTLSLIVSGALACRACARVFVPGRREVSRSGDLKQLASKHDRACTGEKNSNSQRHAEHEWDTGHQDNHVLHHEDHDEQYIASRSRAFTRGEEETQHLPTTTLRPVLILVMCGASACRACAGVFVSGRTKGPGCTPVSRARRRRGSAACGCPDIP